VTFLRFLATRDDLEGPSRSVSTASDRRSSGARRFFLTVPEVMAIFRLGRTTAYALANEYLDTGGRSGLPCEKVGGMLRFPTAEIERLIRRPIDAAFTDGAVSGPAPTTGQIEVTDSLGDHALQQLELRLSQD